MRKSPARRTARTAAAGSGGRGGQLRRVTPLEVMRALLLHIYIVLMFVLTVGFAQLAACDVIVRHGGGERRQIVPTHVRYRFESRGKLDEGWLTECRPEEADAKWQSEHHARGHLHDRIAGTCREPELPKMKRSA